MRETKGIAAVPILIVFYLLLISMILFIPAILSFFDFDVSCVSVGCGRVSFATMAPACLSVGTSLLKTKHHLIGGTAAMPISWLCHEEVSTHFTPMT